MKNTLKKVLAAILTLAMATGTAACTSAEESSKPEAGDAPDSGVIELTGFAVEGPSASAWILKRRPPLRFRRS